MEITLRTGRLGATHPRVKTADPQIGEMGRYFWVPGLFGRNFDYPEVIDRPTREG
jgi:hypothetical protein